MALFQQNDGSGGFMVLEIRNPRISHKMRLHVPSFAAAPGPETGGIAPRDRQYTNQVSGRETTLASTFYEVAVLLRDLYSKDFEIRLAAIYLASGAGVTYGTPGPTGRTFTPVYPVPQIIPILGQSGDNNDWLPGEVTWHIPTHQGGRFFLHMLSTQLWAPDGAKKRVDPFTVSQSGTPPQVLCAYLQGQASGRSASGNPGLGNPSFGAGYTTGTLLTMISGHDGGIIGSPTYATYTMNKRVRRELRYT